MKKTFQIRPFVISLLILCISAGLISWGMLGHERINHLAVLQLPSGPGLFFYNHIDFITQESTVPDLRKYTLADKAEYPRHFADLENYGSRDTLPLTLKELTKKYGEEYVNHNGTLPWYLEEMMEKLTKAFREKRKTEILFLAADLGHYIGDAHMPLHTSVNHNGQLTGQQGIHAFWEAHLPELFADKYVYIYRPAKHVGPVRTAILDLLYDSHSLAERLLQTEKKLRDTVPPERMYAYENGKQKKNKFNQPVHSRYYATLYHTALNGMVEQQLNKAIQVTADFWLTAWINAGSPNLDDLDAPSLNKKNLKNRHQEIERFKKNRIVFPEYEREF